MDNKAGYASERGNLVIDKTLPWRDFKTVVRKPLGDVPVGLHLIVILFLIPNNEVWVKHGKRRGGRGLVSSACNEMLQCWMSAVFCVSSESLSVSESTM